MIDTLFDSLDIFGGTDALPDTDSNVEVGDSGTGSSVSATNSVYPDSLHQQDSFLDNSLNVYQPLSLSAESQINDLSGTDHLRSQTPYESHMQESIGGNMDNTRALQEVGFDGVPKPSLGMDTLQHTVMTHSAASSIDVDNLVNTPTTDHLEVSNEDIDTLQERAKDIERSERKGEISFGSKMCPTRHGCQGATSCDYSYGGYPG